MPGSYIIITHRLTYFDISIINKIVHISDKSLESISCSNIETCRNLVIRIIVLNGSSCIMFKLWLKGKLNIS